ncbi:4-hydroxy-tetrahydrodipicolinate synthase [Oceanobacillus profundus]|uniref:4-hydroxy-tetrahydrodipicolinate synthase n=1 Tax=Oceanobacillus profundus TaxID=372463 RepID=UPI00203DF6D0|nr:4-hydroxy-tetrahydrodipicolinate synthase [Oceanobacillus profundus]MCM3396406.1 4-hydroxy-tetrahydrodipicolinate synthase [Oceanobacillus profundus]
MNFGEVLTAMVTPFDKNGQIDFAQTNVLIDYLIDNGTDALVIAGTTGESPTLRTEEKINLFKYVVKKVDRRVPVIAGTGSNSTEASIDLTKKADECGVDGIMLVTPYYNKPDQRGMYTHFSAIAKETNLPIMLYNIPGRSVVNLTAETVINLSQIDNIVSMKEASGDLDQVSEIIEHTPNDFSVYSGDDGLTIPMLAIGADGVVSVASHVIGNEMQTMVQQFKNGQVQEAAALHRELLPIMNGLFTAPSPSPVKAALQLKGIETGGIRMPLVPLTDEEISKLKLLLDK